jgi:regulator of protease activity HflC (stomatin/prohibitin superfamily)
MNILVPFIDNARPFIYHSLIDLPGGLSRQVVQSSTFIDLRERLLDFPKQSVITADNVVIEINAVLYYRINDAQKAVYAIADLNDAMEKLTQTTLRNILGELTLDETLSSRDQINHRLLDILDDATNRWGVDVTRVELQEITPPPDVRQTMELQMTAERRRRAQMLQAEGDKQAAILTAEGQAEARLREAQSSKQASILKAEGDAEALKARAVAEAKARELAAMAEANALEAIATKVGKEAAVKYLIGVRYLESLQKMADGKSAKTFIPYEAAGALGAVGALREVLQQLPEEGKK